jgi:hypothetical protein
MGTDVENTAPLSSGQHFFSSSEAFEKYMAVSAWALIPPLL